MKKTFISFFLIVMIGTFFIGILYDCDIVGPDSDGPHTMTFGHLSSRRVNILTNLTTAILMTANNKQASPLELFCPIVAIGTDISKRPFRLSYFGYRPLNKTDAENLTNSFTNSICEYAWVSIENNKMKIYKIIDCEIKWVDYVKGLDEFTDDYPLWSSISFQNILWGCPIISRSNHEEKEMVEIIYDESIPINVERYSGGVRLLGVTKNIQVGHQNSFDKVGISVNCLRHNLMAISKDGVMVMTGLPPATEISGRAFYGYEDVACTVEIKQIAIKSEHLPFIYKSFYSEEVLKEMKDSNNPDDHFALGLYYMDENNSNIFEAFKWIEKAALAESDRREDYMKFKQNIEQTLPPVIWK